jgi:crotonobetainyl-CoA:carnitine CoA-transferase CaiB-like acyl-CoA transferase
VVATGTAGESWWETGHLYNGANFNKRSLTLDLNKASGISLLRDLISQCHVLVENYSPRVFEHFGLTWEEVRKIKPNIVFVRMPAYGLDGPWRDRVGFAQTIEMMSGMAWLTGHSDDQPRVQRGTCDPLAGMHAAFAILAGLRERDATGEGVFLECSMVEGALNAAAEQLVEYTAYGHLMERDGNRAPTAAPQGLYYCKLDDGQAPEDENLLALSVENDAQWQSLKRAMGSPCWANDAKFDSHAGRREHHDELDEHIESWTRGQGYDQAVEKILAVGVPAGKVELPRDAYVHPQYVARGFLEDVEHPVIGRHPIPGMPFRLASRGDKGWIYSPAPTLGQHNHEILSQLLGQSDADIESLEREEVIGTIPSGLD